MNRFIKLVKFILQFTQIRNLLNGPVDPFRKRESTMIKEVIEQAATSIEIKLNKLYFKMALSFIVIGVLAYCVIRLIWHFEKYLLQSYGENYALLMLTVIAVSISFQMIYAKLILDRANRKKQDIINEKVRLEIEAGLHKSVFLAAPEKLFQQAIKGFLAGFAKRPLLSNPTPTVAIHSGSRQSDDLN